MDLDLARKSLLGTSVAIAALFALGSHAVLAGTYDLSASFASGTLGTFTLSGQITENGTAVTGFTGNTGGTFGSQFGAITGIIAGGPTTFIVSNSNGDHLIADNVWKASSPNFTTNGIDFVTASGMVMNLWQNSANSFTLFSGYEGTQYKFGTAQTGYAGTATVSGFNQTGSGSLVAAPVPEPSELLLSIGGFGLIGFLARRRKSDSSNVPLAV